jgi:uncharacterized protein (TIGR02118 family)
MSPWVTFALTARTRWLMPFVAGGGAAPAPFVAACHLYFNAAADFQKGIGAHGKEIMGDIPNYTDLAPQIQVSEIVIA